MLWIIVLVLAAIALSVIIGGGLNLAFLKILFIFSVGILVVFSIKKIWDSFKK